MKSYEERNFHLWPFKGSFYLFPHYMKCMSWSPDKGQKVYRWLWFIFAIDR